MQAECAQDNAEGIFRNKGEIPCRNMDQYLVHFKYK